MVAPMTIHSTLPVSAGQYSYCLLRGQRPPSGIIDTVPFMGCCDVCGLHIPNPYPNSTTWRWPRPVINTPDQGPVCSLFVYGLGGSVGATVKASPNFGRSLEGFDF